MQIIGEKINGTRKKVGEAIVAKDAQFIQDLAQSQAQAGADYLDVNAGTNPENETQDLIWLVQTVQEVTEVPLCLDSSSPAAIEAAMPHVARTPMINSINGDAKRLEGMLPIVAQHACPVIGLALDESGMPKTVQDRLRVVRRIMEATRQAGVPDEHLFIDPLIMTVATSTTAALEALECIRSIKGEFPEVHITGGLSNVSFGLPQRSVINRTFVALAIEAGMDSAIMDPNDQPLTSGILAAELLMGRDRFCRNYTQAARQGLVS
ncbi:MAG: methyltetrahydrofolate cobalamin methyltransferase [Desulfarculaceae bacterium]|nr:methyltetrahydrofolate cobalamin methyltransferase [Desulfarculaceae bacterium]